MKLQVAILLTLSAMLIGCGQSSNTPSAKVSAEWMNTVRQAAAKGGGGGEVKVVKADGWGNLKGRFILKGTLPSLNPVVPNQDVAYCNSHMPKNEEIVVGDNSGLNNVVVFLKTNVTPHADYTKSGEVTVLDNKGCRFVPHVCLVPRRHTFVISNSDDVGHNTKREFNIQIAAGARTEQAFAADDLGDPSAVVCSIHGWMKGYLLVRENPYMRVTTADGSFELKNVPAGIPLEFRVWHERSPIVQGTIDKVQGAASAPTLNRGRLTITVPKDQDVSFEMTIDAATLSGG